MSIKISFRKSDISIALTNILCFGRKNEPITKILAETFDFGLLTEISGDIWLILLTNADIGFYQFVSFHFLGKNCVSFRPKNFGFRIGLASTTEQYLQRRHQNVLFVKTFFISL